MILFLACLSLNTHSLVDEQTLLNWSWYSLGYKSVQIEMETHVSVLDNIAYKPNSLEYHYNLGRKNAYKTCSDILMITTD